MRWVNRVRLPASDLAALLGYGLLTLIFTYPLGLHIGSYVVGLDVDAEEYLWSFWWVRKALLELHTNPYLTTWLYYPRGVSLYFFAFNPLHAFLSVPLQQLFGLTVAYNLMGLLTFVVAGYTTYRLALDVAGSRSASFVAGVLFAFAPTQIFHLEVGQPNLQAVEFMPLYVLCARRWFKGSELRWLLGAAIALALNSFNDWQFAVYCQLFTAVLLLAELWSRRAQWRAALLDLAWRAAAMQILYTLVIAPVLIPMAQELAGPDQYMVRKRIDTVYHSADLLAFLVPNPMHPLWREWAEPLRVSLQTPGVLVTVVSLSYVGLLLMLVAIGRAWRESRFWFGTGLLFLILSLGPDLLVLGQNTGLLLPYDLLFQLPIIQISRAPARYITVTLLCLAVLAAIGARELFTLREASSEKRDERRKKKDGSAPVRPSSSVFRPPVLFPLVVLILLVFELLPAPLHAHAPAEAPAFFTDGTLRDAGALLEVPNPSNRGMYYATLHGRPVSYGELSRDNPGGPLLKYIRNGLWINDVVEDTSSWGCIYGMFDITHVVLYPQESQDWRTRQGIVERRLGAEALVSATPQGKLYRLPATVPGDTCVLVGEGWRGTRPFDGTDTLYRWTDQTPTLGLVRREPGLARLHFTAHSFAVLRQLEVRMGDQVVGRFEISGTPQPYTLEIDLPVGVTWLELHSLQPAVSPADYGYNETELIAIGYSQLWVEPAMTR